MPRKDRITRRLDLPAPVMHGAAGAADSTADDPAPPAPPDAPDAPTNIALTTGITYATASPLAYIAATWIAPSGSTPTRYAFQVSESSSFPDASTLTFTTNVPSIRADGLKPATAYYCRVAGVAKSVQGDWGYGTPYPITTASDTSPAGVPTSVSATWIGYGDLLITWTNPTEANFKDVQVVIRASSGGTIYRTVYSAVGRFLYTLAMNKQDTSGAGDSSLYVELRSRTFSNVLGTIVNTGLVTKSAPSNPSGLTAVWNGAQGSLLLDWADVADAAQYELTLDAKAYIVFSSSYTYPVARNTQDHGGTPDPTITYTLKAVDGFGQKSSGVSGTSTLARPAAPATVTHGWTSDPGTAGADLVFAWSAVADVAYYTINLNSTGARQVGGTTFTYDYERNVAENGAPGDPSITYDVRSVDGLGQSSTSGTTGTATNAAPTTPTATLTQGAVSGLYATVTSASVADFWRYEYVFKRDSTTVATVYSAASSIRYEMQGAGDEGYHSWTVVIRQEDVFAQFSSTVTPSAIAFEGLSLTGLRAQAAYTDSDGNTAVTLAVLKDGITTSGGVSYAA